MILTEIIAASDDGRMIKHFVRSKMGVSYGQFSSLKVRDGIRVNGMPVHANHIIHTGDCVEVDISETSHSSVDPIAGDVNVVFENERIMIIDKQAPLACQSSSRNSAAALENYLMHKYGPDYIFRPLNRLDKGTSGLLCAAKNAHVCQLLQKKLHTGEFLREYLAVVEGELPGEGVIDLPIAKADGATVKRVVDMENGKRSVTHFCCERMSQGRTLVRLRLETGRTHQIRVHMSHIGHPICGDFLYGTELESLPGRFALHSARLCVDDPVSGETIDISSQLPIELESLLQ